MGVSNYVAGQLRQAHDVATNPVTGVVLGVAATPATAAVVNGVGQAAGVAADYLEHGGPA